MFRRPPSRATGPLAAAALLAFLLPLGCGKDSTTNPDPANPMPDFSIADVNPNSATNGEMVSPRDHLGDVSAWYFGHAT
ncbi:MAG: hypothetical protein R3B81_05395 [bacterium]